MCMSCMCVACVVFLGRQIRETHGTYKQFDDARHNTKMDDVGVICAKHNQHTNHEQTLNLIRASQWPGRERVMEVREAQQNHVKIYGFWDFLFLFSYRCCWFRYGVPDEHARAQFRGQTTRITIL